MEIVMHSLTFCQHDRVITVKINKTDTSIIRVTSEVLKVNVGSVRTTE